MNKVEYYKVYNKYESFGVFENKTSIDVICQTQNSEEAIICHTKAIKKFYEMCDRNINSQDIIFCTDIVTDNRTNIEIPFDEITSLFNNCTNRWWHKPVLEKVSLEFFNKLENDE